MTGSMFPYDGKLSLAVPLLLRRPPTKEKGEGGQGGVVGREKCTKERKKNKYDMAERGGGVLLSEKRSIRGPLLKPVRSVPFLCIVPSFESGTP